MTCSTLGRIIETAIAMKAVPSPSHLPRLRLIVEEVYIHRAELTDASLKMLLKHIKSAFQAGWFSNEDKDRLLMMVDKTSLGYYNLDNWNVEPANAHSVSEIISRFYPRMRVEHILASFNVKAGDKGSEAYFDISPNTVPHQNLWLLVARTDDMDTAACLTSPSNVDFLINNSEVPNRTRKKMVKGPQLPTNVTKMVKDGVNCLQAIGEFDGEYVIALAIMSLISSPDPSRLQDYVYPISSDVESDLFKEKLDRLKELYRNLKDPARLRAVYEAHRLKHLQAKVCKGLRQKLAQHRQFHFPPDRNRMTYPGVYSGDDCCSGMVRRAKGTTCKNGYDYYNPLLNGSVDISDLEAKGPSPWKVIRLE